MTLQRQCLREPGGNMTLFDRLPRISPAAMQLQNILAVQGSIKLSTALGDLRFELARPESEKPDLIAVTLFNDDLSLVIMAPDALIDIFCDHIIPGWEAETTIPKDWRCILTASFAADYLEPAFGVLSARLSKADEALTGDIVFLTVTLAEERYLIGFKLCSNSMARIAAEEPSLPDMPLPLAIPLTLRLCLGKSALSRRALSTIREGDFLLIEHNRLADEESALTLPGLGDIHGYLEGTQFTAVSFRPTYDYSV